MAPSAIYVEDAVTKLTSQQGILDASNLEIQLTTTPKPIPSPAKPTSTCTDHMITAQWTSTSGWSNPQLTAYGPITLYPTSSVLQYGTECFEGMKVYRGHDGRLRLFRPMENCERMRNSACRISLPDFDPRELCELIRKLCAVDGAKWLPVHQPGKALYIRPTLVGSDPSLGFDVPREATLMVFMAVGMSVKSERAEKRGLRLLASTGGMVRAWPGGTGDAKVGGNYGPALLLHGRAKRDGYDQVLWLFGEDGRITEAGSSNFFAIWRAKDSGRLQMVTPSLQDGLILPGITRRSILELSRDRRRWVAADEEVEELEVLEQVVTRADIVTAAQSGRLLSVFTTGTANFVTSVSEIDFGDCQVVIPQNAVPHTTLLQTWMADIMYGREDTLWTEIVEEE